MATIGDRIATSKHQGVELAMVRLSAQQASDLIGAIQDAAAHALGFSQALAVAGQTDSARPTAGEAIEVGFSGAAEIQ